MISVILGLLGKVGLGKTGAKIAGFGILLVAVGIAFFFIKIWISSALQAREDLGYAKCQTEKVVDANAAAAAAVETLKIGLEELQAAYEAERQAATVSAESYRALVELQEQKLGEAQQAIDFAKDTISDAAWWCADEPIPNEGIAELWWTLEGRAAPGRPLPEDPE